jgi:HTH-like domain
VKLCETVRVRYEFIEAHQGVYPVTGLSFSIVNLHYSVVGESPNSLAKGAFPVPVDCANLLGLYLCEFLRVSRSGYYTYLRHQPSQRERENGALVKVIKNIHQQSKQRYGSPRIHAELKQQGRPESLGKVKRLMRQEGIYAVPPRKYQPQTSTQGEVSVETVNLLKDNTTMVWNL